MHFPVFRAFCLTAVVLPMTSSVEGPGCLTHQAGTLLMITLLTPAINLLHPSPGGEATVPARSGALRMLPERRRPSATVGPPEPCAETLPKPARR